jgi:hypothetical protein
MQNKVQYHICFFGSGPPEIHELFGQCCLGSWFKAHWNNFRRSWRAQVADDVVERRRLAAELLGALLPLPRSRPRIG